jgi:hypothetical protein
VATQYITRFEQQKAKYNPASVQSYSQNVSTASLSTGVKPTMPPSTKQCKYCKQEIEYQANFCKHCGTQQDNLQCNGTSYKGYLREVVCKKCSCKQEGALIDAMNTKYCTFCGSDQLEWKLYGL